MTRPCKSFETERTRKFRSLALDQDEQRTIGHIEEFGLSVFHIKAGASSPGFSYTVGLFDTCGSPELIVVGLKEPMAHFLLNEAAMELRKGTNLSRGRHRELIGEVECEFRPVDLKWTRHLMNWTNWYYASEEVPVLQAVYPDLGNNFPDEPGFNDYFQQPLLQPDTPMREIENDFWSSTDPKSSLFDWKFPDPPHTGVFLSEGIHSGSEAVTYVSRDIEDAAWQFLGDSMAGDSEPVLSCFHHVIDTDPSLKELADLPLGWYAEREKVGEPWLRRKHAMEEERVD